MPHCTSTAGVGQFNSNSAWSGGLQSVVHRSLGRPKTLSGTDVGQTILIGILRTHLSFFNQVDI